jgi:hypothetical protein
MPRVTVVVWLAVELKFCMLEVAVFMLLAKLYIATAAAAITAIPTPVKAKKVP